VIEKKQEAVVVEKKVSFEEPNYIEMSKKICYVLGGKPEDYY